MSTTRPCSPGDRGPGPYAESGGSAPEEAASGAPIDVAASTGSVPPADSGADTQARVPGAQPCGAEKEARGTASGSAEAAHQGAAPHETVTQPQSNPRNPRDRQNPRYRQNPRDPDPAGRRTLRLSFRDASGVVPMARDFTRQALHTWGWLPSVTADQRAAAEDVLLVVSELVTNACLHAQGPEELRITCERKVLRIEVTDRGAGQPAPRTPHRAGRPGGHGMFIVQRLCLDWGVIRAPGVPGKTVWAHLGAPA